MRTELKRIVESTDSNAGKMFDYFIQCLVILSVVSFSIETLPDLELRLVRLLNAIEIVVVTIFTIEYLLRLIIADNKAKFVFSFYGIVDLLAILPFYLSTGIDLRSVRVFRLIRIFRLLKLARYNAAIRRFHLALQIAREELVLFACSSVILLYVSAVGVYHFENQAQPEQFASVFHTLWWAVATLTTVGYGDVYPVTVGGRILTFFVLMVGLGVVAVPTGLVASALSQARELENEAHGDV